MSHYHCVVWNDHREAHVIEFNPDDAEASVIHPKSRHQRSERVVSVETVDHPTDGELLQFARRHFAADDKMRPQA